MENYIELNEDGEDCPLLLQHYAMLRSMELDNPSKILLIILLSPYPRGWGFGYWVGVDKPSFFFESLVQLVKAKMMNFKVKFFLINICNVFRFSKRIFGPRTQQFQLS